MALNDNLKQRRIELRLTMAELAGKVGVSEATISRWESGDISNMRLDKIVPLARALQVPPAYIIGLEEDINGELGIDSVYLQLARKAQDEHISPSDIMLVLDTIKKLKNLREER